MALAALITALLLTGCVAPRSSSVGPDAAAGTAASSPSPTVAARSAAPSLAARTPKPVSTLPPPAHRPQTIHVLEDPISFHTVAAEGCTSAAGCEGDQLIGTSRMLDADTRVNVGSFAVKCVLLDPAKNLYHCPANTLTLTGRGQIVFEEIVYIGGQWNPVPWPILSGTGEFLGVTGSVISPENSAWSYGDFVISITG
jgi:hypothetical protein